MNSLERELLIVNTAEQVVREHLEEVPEYLTISEVLEDIVESEDIHDLTHEVYNLVRVELDTILQRWEDELE